MHRRTNADSRLLERTGKAARLAVGVFLALAWMGALPAPLRAQRFEHIDPIFFTKVYGGANPLPQVLTVTSAGSAFGFHASATTSTGGGWLAASPAGDCCTTPAPVQAIVNASATLPVGSYSGQIVLAAGGTSLIVPVTLVVAPSDGAAFDNTPGLLSFSMEPGGQSPSQTLQIGNAGTGTLHWRLIASTFNGANFLSASVETGTAPTLVSVRVLPENLPGGGATAGIYTGRLLFLASGSTVTVPVSVSVGDAGFRQTGPLSLSKAPEGDDPLPKPVAITSTGAEFGFTLSSSTAKGGDWLSVSPSGDCCTTPQTLRVSVNSAVRLAPGTYTGQILVSTANRALAISVTLTVTAPGARRSLSTAGVNLFPVSTENVGCGGFGNQDTGGGGFTVAPDGANTGRLVTEANASNGPVPHYEYLFLDPGLGQQTLSFFFKPGSNSWVYIFSQVDGVTQRVWFNLSGSGAVGSNVPAGWTAVITQAPNGWYRCSVTYTVTSSSPKSGFGLATADQQISYTATPGNGVYQWGQELENGPLTNYQANDGSCMSISNDEDADAVSAGSQIGFIIAVTNSSAPGIGAATSAALNAPLPAGPGLNWSVSQYAGPGTCTVNGAVGSQALACSFGTLDGGLPPVLVHVISGTTALSCGIYTNTATASASNGRSTSVLANPTRVLCPLLSVTKTADSATAPPGSPIGFVLSISNSSAAGTITATTVALHDPLPAGTGVNWSISPAYSGLGTCSVTGAVGSQILACNLGSVPPGVAAVVHITSGTTASSCGTYPNTAVVTATNSPALQSSATTGVTCSGLSITKSHGSFTQGQRGATYTVTVSNANGANPTSGTVTVTDTVPSGLTLVSMAGAGWTCPGTAANNCTRADALAGGSSYLPITVTVDVAINATSPLVNNVSVTGGGSPGANASDPTVVAVQALRFVPLTPCRVADTRHPNGAFGSPSVAGGASRDFIIPNSACLIPITAQAYSFNVAVVPPGPLGFLTLYPAGQTRPVASTLNSVDGRIKSNAAIVPAGTGGAVSVFASNNTDVVLDINGYFVPASDATALAFYPVTPCRLVDTRRANAPLAGPPLVGQQSRTFPLLTGPCNLPASAQAYSLNFAAVPSTPLGFLTAFPTGLTRPVAANLNALTVTVTANAAIVPAGTNGSIDVFVSNNTNLVIDVNGYFAPMNPGGLSMYALAPCRVVDTRQPPGSQPVTSLDVAVSASPCAPYPTAQAYVFSVTAVPPGPLGFLTLWPQGQPRPVVATLNASDGVTTSNMAIVPTANRSISAFPSNPTHLILDILGYFGQ